ncbi:peptidylprolyl isomerase [Rhodopseudomonas rhenobacensis]|uniref:Parvulin-like PPIase n=1 Tax=Rhodopseudomonas rhenobacensis TaxID=87461 RepID=A0A7W7Z5B5_9BRAD|nr:peptidylprolyl isomerase [Rhodopseudomonas rhenobacensis]MBB5048293.1 peptidylprolyl isomerase [Rhodopseudomonas rhenobacensis]
MTMSPFTTSTVACVAVIAALAGASGGSAQAQTAPPVANAAPARPVPAKPVAAAQPAAAVQQRPQAVAVKPVGVKAATDVVARVGDNELTADDLRAQISALAPNDRAVLAKDPGQLSQVVRMLLANQLVLDEVADKKWEQRPEVVAQLNRVRESALVELYLQSVSAPPSNFPTEDELQKVYDANRGQLVVPRQYQLSQIFIASAKDADKASEDRARKKLDDIQKKLKAAGADFAAIAGDDSDAKGSVDLGMIPETQIIPEIRAHIVGLAKGAVSDPVRLDDGWHILKLTDTKASYTRTLLEVREQLVQQLRKERAGVMRRGYLAELLKQHPPVLNELALSNLLDNSSK